MSRFSSFFRPILTTLLLFSAVSLSGFCPEAPEAAGLPPQETLRSIGASMEAADTASFQSSSTWTAFQNRHSANWRNWPRIPIRPSGCPRRLLSWLRMAD